MEIIPTISVSAVITVYNPEQFYFEKAVSSVLTQSYGVKELVLVNDGGTESYREWLPDDRRVKCYTRMNGGVAAARNFAIQQCTGEYIAFLDQDDFWYPDKLHLQTAMLQDSEKLCVILSSADIVGEDDEVLVLQGRESKKNRFLQTTPDTLLFQLAFENFIYSSTPLFHREVFSITGGFDPYTQPHDDWDIYLRIALAGIPFYCYKEKPLSVWRVHKSNASKNNRKMIQSKCRVEKKILQMSIPPALRSLLRTNLGIDNLRRLQLIYKTQRYACFRKLLCRYLIEVRDYVSTEEMTDIQAYRAQKDRVRKLVMKSCLRYVLSWYMQIVKK